MRNMASGSGASPKGIAAIVGVGPKLGRSIARKFAHEGYTVAILSRDLGRLSRLAEEIAREEKAQVFAIRIDCSDSKSIREAFEGVLSLGFVEILVYNAHHRPPPPPPPPLISLLPQPSPDSTSSLSSFSCTSNTQVVYPRNFMEIKIDSFEKSVAVSTLGALQCAQKVVPSMLERGRGTILFTGCSASLNGIPGFAELCCGKFALRALSQCLAREIQPLGIHVAHVIIDGIVGTPRLSSLRSIVGEQQGEGASSTMDPDALAQTYWYLHVQDRTAWTQEIDLRSSNQIYF